MFCFVMLKNSCITDLQYIHNGFRNYHDCTICKIVSYRFDCQHKASVGEEDCANWNTEVAAEHVHDVRFIVVSRSGGVVVWPTGALHPLRNVSD